ncbi:MAG: hypothetical protein AAFV53_18555 [Myxococcota bacterium]
MLFGLLLWGCGPKTGALPHIDEITWPERVPEAGAVLHLLAPGEAPRQTIQLTPNLDDTFNVSLSLSIETWAETDQQPMAPPVRIPVHTETRYRVDQIDGDGSMHLSGEIADVHLNDGASALMIAVMSPTMSRLVGTTAEMVMRPSGEIVSSTRIDAQGQQQQLGDDMMSLRPWFPEQPVGVGARWEILDRAEQNGMMVARRVIQRITDIDAGVITLDTKIEQHLIEVINFTDLPRGAQLQNAAMDSYGAGLSRVDLSLPMPLAASIDLQSVVSADILLEDLPLQQTITTQTRSEVSARRD